MRELFIRTAPYLVLALGVVLQIVMISFSFEFLISNLLTDDAFYYFEIARNIVAGHGPTFDGSNLTNGYHPLWLLVLLPIFAFFTGTVPPLYAVLALSILLSAGTGFVLMQLFKHVTNDRTLQAFALSLWCLNPWMLYETLNGLETALSLFLFALFLLACVRAAEDERMERVVLAGAVGAFMVLARLDLVFYVVAVAGWWLFRKKILRAAVFGGTGVALVLPWAVLNYLSFGMLSTSAADGASFVYTSIITGSSDPSLATHVMYGTAYVFQELIALLWDSNLWWIVGILAVALIGAPIARVQLPFQKGILVAFIVGFLLLVLGDAGVRLVVRPWYFLTALPLLCIGILALQQGTSIRGRQLIVVVLVMACAFYWGWGSDERDYYRYQLGVYEATLWMNEHLPREAIVGSLNAGIPGYFADATVINLDGLVNNAAYKALVTNTMLSYIYANEIHYLIDMDGYMQSYALTFGFEQVTPRLTPLYTVSTHRVHDDRYEHASVFKIE